MYKPEYMKLFGATIKKLVAERNWNQRQFAKRENLKADFINKLINFKMIQARKAISKNMFDYLGK